MTAPLYVELQTEPPEITSKGNRGLWFERFFNQYKDQQQWANPKPDSAANATWLKNHFNNNTNRVVGDDKQLAAHAQAQMQLAASLQGQSHIFKASWHFVTGMGNPHPVENGFAWHPTLGVPYLTGAAVKGLVRSYIENNLCTDDDSGNPDKLKLLLDWFGSIDKSPDVNKGKIQAGNLIFFDALPIKPVTLGVDIMTPHMGKWYEKGGDITDVTRQPEAVPADWHDPVPVSFLVAKEVTLLFSFALRQYPDADSKRPAIDLADVADVLNRVLEQSGAGGKTATGYGEMIDLEKQVQLDKTLKEAALLTDAERMEGYLKINTRNNSLYLERSGQQLAFATGNKPNELLALLPEATVKILKTGKGVKVNAYVTKKEILKVELH
ncbi:type III-B CRISPR module RAMP protein Cmr6 [Thiothrix subterranea]|uniref:Type III-B CRISPR module RAMP protein Cmr6 n=1 Tax=Thiothrix subterranea TaxID=2735563 RepID=A0AA51MMI9_9GAMM|nr:type III-B CRISPR module RAMP protein Cmr6 [Thiothrix subterranea]MDQ5770589.1 type III-B CRISPR module RAMP protein Cmr6 [Thiothrix subterranea]WML86928.1 type III-B CRISPR module RAMP protein Cmr6 [Thiothrix subterranea]